MSGSTIIEDPAIPLVTRNGKYKKYVQDEELASPSSTSPKSAFENISYRLSRRKQLFQKRCRIVDIEFTLAVTGIILMMIDTELYIGGIYSKSSAGSIILKSFVSATTVGLLGAVVAYHVTGIQLVMTDNGLEDWRLAMSTFTYLKIGIEMIVCAIHPLPGDIRVLYWPKTGSSRMVSIDAVLSILMMMMRLYIVGKFLVMHSRLLTDTSTQSLGALNKVKINLSFVLKALMSTNPGTMLVGIMLLIFLVGSWAMRTCEVYYNPDLEHSSFLNSMWLIAITFLTVGYGDITPNSYCGRFIAVCTGLMGVGTTALLVAVLAQKLEQTRAEKYVHNFVTRAQLDKRRKHAAADVIKQMIVLWKMKKSGVRNEHARIRHRSKLLHAIQTMKLAKNEKISIGESSIGVVEVCKTVADVYSLVEEMRVEQRKLRDEVSGLESGIHDIGSKLDHLQKRLSDR